MTHDLDQYRSARICVDYPDRIESIYSKADSSSLCLGRGLIGYYEHLDKIKELLSVGDVECVHNLILRCHKFTDNMKDIFYKQDDYCLEKYFEHLSNINGCRLTIKERKNHTMFMWMNNQWFFCNSNTNYVLISLNDNMKLWT